LNTKLQSYFEVLGLRMQVPFQQNFHAFDTYCVFISSIRLNSPGQKKKSSKLKKRLQTT